LPTRPEYFLQDAEINREGASALSDLHELLSISASELKSMLDEGVVALAVRPCDQFARGHVPGSINIALSGQFASWAGTVLGLSARPVLIADSPEQLSEAQLRLARVGIEDARGYLNGGVEAWTQAGFELAELPQIDAQTLLDRLQADATQVLDVRRESEWQAGHIEGARWWPLDNFKVSTPEIDRERPIAVHCKSGYRSMIACSLLQRAGFRNITNVIGGFDAWQQARLPVQREIEVEAQR
jgi:hydroxyacylglutathione hydrolase